MASSLQVSDLAVRYDTKTVVDGLSFELDESEILMLVGPTGCGKTTVLQALAGLLPIAKGEIELGGWRANPQRTVPPEQRNMGMVFQDFALFPHLTVVQNVGFRTRDSVQAEYWLELLGLTDLRDAKPAQLSGGQKQRVALARTLAHQPSCVLLDEPLSNLDAALKDDVRWQIRNALKAAGVPAIWVTHDQEEALSVGDRVGVLRRGRLEQLDTPEVCYSRPANRFVARFLGEASLIPGRTTTEHVVTTVLGNAPGVAIGEATGEVDLLLRPDDIALTKAADGNGVVTWARYEGSARLYAVTTDEGDLVKIRCSHEVFCEPGERVQLAIATTHPLAYFSRVQ